MPTCLPIDGGTGIVDHRDIPVDRALLEQFVLQDIAGSKASKQLAMATGAGGVAQEIAARCDW